MDQLLFAPVNHAEIDPGRDFADFIANPLREQRSLRVIEDDAFLLVEPAFVLVDFGHDRPVSEREDFVPQLAFHRIEDFAFPGEEVHEARDLARNFAARGHDRRAFAFAARNFAGRTLCEKSDRAFPRASSGIPSDPGSWSSPWNEMGLLSFGVTRVLRNSMSACLSASARSCRSNGPCPR